MPRPPIVPPPRQGPTKGMWKTPVRDDLLPAEGLPAGPSQRQGGDHQPRERSNASGPTSRPAKKRAKRSKRQESGEDDDTDKDCDPDYDSREEGEEGSPRRRAPRSNGSRKQAGSGGGGGGGGVISGGSKQFGGGAQVPSPKFCGFFRTQTEMGLGVYDNVFVCGPGGPGDASTLAAVGMDVGRTGRMTYTRAPLFSSRTPTPPMSCATYDDLLLWLASLGATRDHGVVQDAQAQQGVVTTPVGDAAPAQATPTPPPPPLTAPPSPPSPPPGAQELGRPAWLGWREDAGSRPDGGPMRTFLLISAADGTETAAVTGSEDPATRQWGFTTLLSRPGWAAGAQIGGGRPGVLAFLAACMHDCRSAAGGIVPNAAQFAAATAQSEVVTPVRPMSTMPHSHRGSPGDFHPHAVHMPWLNTLGLGPPPSSHAMAPPARPVASAATLAPAAAYTPGGMLTEAQERWCRSVPSEEEVNQFKAWKEALERYFHTTNTLSDHQAMSIMCQLEACPISLELLEASQIGRVINSLRRYARPPVATLAARVIVAWERTATQVMAACGHGLMVPAARTPQQ